LGLDVAFFGFGDIVRGDKRRRLHKAFLRYHDATNWPLLREALKSMGRADLIGNGKHHLIPTFQPLVKTGASATAAGSKPKKGNIQTQHTGLPPRDNGGKAFKGSKPRK
ncbi:MAG TPA: DUF3362 domain-containing protein, partial [Burkholderiaceae bacterium]|nr:DUF3362 domain-containing protein [Burkholderiaceae bacterium]